MSNKRCALLAAAALLLGLTACASDGPVTGGIIGDGFNPHITVRGANGEEAALNLSLFGDNLFALSGYLDSGTSQVGGGVSALGGDGLVHGGLHLDTPAANLGGDAAFIGRNGLLSANGHVTGPFVGANGEFRLMGPQGPLVSVSKPAPPVGR